MSTYVFKAIDLSGGKARGEVEAESKQAVSDQLKSRVGGQTLTVRPVEESRLPDVVQILRDVTHAQVQQLTGSPSVIAPVDDEAMLPRVVARLASAGIAVLELELGRPSLDEVFLTITGHRAEEENQS